MSKRRNLFSCLPDGAKEEKRGFVFRGEKELVGDGGEEEKDEVSILLEGGEGGGEEKDEVSIFLGGGLLGGGGGGGRFVCIVMTA